MKQCHRIPRLVALTTLVLIVLGGVAMAQEEVTYTWTAPTTGSAVHHYVFQQSVDEAPFVTIDDNVLDNTFVITLDYSLNHVVRIAGVDSLGRQGPWSVSSDPYTPSLGSPGVPGKPVAVF
jgi:hypothetical protein